MREKFTVYLNANELLALDETILELRRRYGIKVTRSTYVMEAIRTSSIPRIAGHIVETETQ